MMVVAELLVLAAAGVIVEEMLPLALTTVIPSSRSPLLLVDVTALNVVVLGAVVVVALVELFEPWIRTSLKLREGLVPWPLISLRTWISSLLLLTAAVEVLVLLPVLTDTL